MSVEVTHPSLLIVIQQHPDGLFNHHWLKIESGSYRLMCHVYSIKMLRLGLSMILDDVKA
jgi:hypothetical protein